MGKSCHVYRGGTGGLPNCLPCRAVWQVANLANRQAKYRCKHWTTLPEHEAKVCHHHGVSQRLLYRLVQAFWITPEGVAIIIVRATPFLRHLQEARGPLTRPRSQEEEVLRDLGPTQSHRGIYPTWRPPPLEGQHPSGAPPRLQATEG